MKNEFDFGRKLWSKDSWKRYRALDKGDGLTGHIGNGDDVQKRADTITQLSDETSASNLIDYGVNEYLYEKLPSNINITSIEIDPDARATLNTYKLINGDYREVVKIDPQNNTIYTYHLFMDKTGEQLKLAKEVIRGLVDSGVQNSYMIVWKRVTKTSQTYTTYDLSTGLIVK